jgi:hypothetical protein
MYSFQRQEERKPLSVGGAILLVVLFPVYYPLYILLYCPFALALNTFAVTVDVTFDPFFGDDESLLPIKPSAVCDRIVHKPVSCLSASMCACLLPCSACGGVLIFALGVLFVPLGLVGMILLLIPKGLVAGDWDLVLSCPVRGFIFVAHILEAWSTGGAVPTANLY